MKRVLHIQQMGKTKTRTGDLLVQGRDEFNGDLSLARVVGNTGDKGNKRLHFVSLLDVESERATDWRAIAMQQEEIAANHLADIGIW